MESVEYPDSRYLDSLNNAEKIRWLSTWLRGELRPYSELGLYRQR